MKKKILIALVLILALSAYLGQKTYKAIYSSNVTESFSFWIDEESSFEELLKVYGTYFERLSDFERIAEWKGLSKKLKVGHYEIKEGMSANTVVNTLLSGRQSPIRLTINLVKDLKGLSRFLGDELMHDSADFIAYFYSEAFRKKYDLKNSEALGFFIPNTYEFYWTTSPEAFAERMADENERFWSKRQESLKNSTLTKKEVISLASIVESETARFDEMPKVAGLYLNRLKRNILLQSDPTVIYAWQQVYPNDKIKRVLLKHLEIPSPYNTYKNLGLPPGPIRMVSPQAIDAVLKAESHSYIFMCADPERPGYHAFATNLRQHNANRRRYINWLETQNRIARSRK